MPKGKLTKDRQYHGQREADKRQTISWPKENGQKTDNIMAKEAMIVSVFFQLPFGHDIVCLFSASFCP
jgi:hypothetical protein